MVSLTGKRKWSNDLLYVAEKPGAIVISRVFGNRVFTKNGVICHLSGWLLPPSRSGNSQKRRGAVPTKREFGMKATYKHTV